MPSRHQSPVNDGMKYFTPSTAAMHVLSVWNVRKVLLFFFLLSLLYTLITKWDMFPNRAMKLTIPVEHDIISSPFAGKVELPIDHFNTSDKRKFQNRYWMNDTFYQSNGPIFLL